MIPERKPSDRFAGIGTVTGCNETVTIYGETPDEIYSIGRQQAYTVDVHTVYTLQKEPSSGSPSHKGD